MYTCFPVLKRNLQQDSAMLTMPLFVYICLKSAHKASTEYQILFCFPPSLGWVRFQRSERVIKMFLQDKSINTGAGSHAIATPPTWRPIGWYCIWGLSWLTGRWTNWRMGRESGRGPSMRIIVRNTHILTHSLFFKLVSENSCSLRLNRSAYPSDVDFIESHPLTLQHIRNGTYGRLGHACHLWFYEAPICKAHCKDTV